MYDDTNTFTHLKHTLINKYHPTISVNREGSGSDSSPPTLSDQDTAPTTLSGGRLDNEDWMGEKGGMKPGDPFVLGPSPDDMTPVSPLQSSGSRNRPDFNNNTKEDRSDGDLTLRGKCLAHSSADAPMSQGASADEGTTHLPPRVSESEDQSASPITTRAPDLLNGRLVQPRDEYMTQPDFFRGDLAKAQGAIHGEKGVTSMVGCTIGDIVPIDVSGQSRDIDLPVRQVGWTLGLREEEEEDNAKPNSSGILTFATTSPSNSTVVTAVTTTSPSPTHVTQISMEHDLTLKLYEGRQKVGTNPEVSTDNWAKCFSQRAAESEDRTSGLLTTTPSTIQMKKTTEHMHPTTNPPNKETLTREPNILEEWEHFTPQNGSPRAPIVLSRTSETYYLNISDLFPRLPSTGSSADTQPPSVNVNTRPLYAEGSSETIGKTMAGKECIQSFPPNGSPAVSTELSRQKVEVSIEDMGVQEVDLSEGDMEVDMTTTITVETEVQAHPSLHSDTLVSYLMLPSVEVNRLAGGAPPKRTTPGRVVKDTSSRPDPTFPAPLNVVDLDIPQMKNQLLVVADSTIPGAGKGLFTLKNVPAGTRICTYEGERLSKEDLPIPNIFPRFDYVWTNNTLTIIIDGYNKTSFGPFMNDPADEELCNADIVQRNSKVYVETTRELFSFEEVLTSYGGGYWADRFHLFLDSIGKHHSDFQLRLIRNYKIRPLPSGRALTNQEVLIKTIPLNYTIPDLPEKTLLSNYVIDILRDTYGTSNTLSIQLGFPRFCRSKHLHTLLTEIQSFPIRYAAGIIRRFLQKYPAITVHAWRLRDDSLYSTCRPDGTCGFQLLYQMHRRGRDGRNPDHFENIYLPKHLPGFKAFIKSLIEGYENTPTRTDPGAIPKLQFFLQWLERDPKPAFELKDWLSTDELFFLTALVDKHYTVMSYDPDRNAIPVLEDRENWIYLYHDTEFPGVAPSFNLDQIEVILRRNNFALFSHSHFYPFPTTTSLIDDLDRAFT